MLNRCRFIFICLAVALSACSTKHYRKSADKEVAAIIAQKTPAVPNMDTNFTIEVGEKVELASLPVSAGAEEFFGAESSLEKGARIISLEKALEIATKQSRAYQNRKELLYLEALALTMDRHRFTPIFSAGTDTRYRTTRELVEGVDTIIENELDPDADPIVVPGVDRIVDQRSSETRSEISMDLLLRTGGRIAVAFSTDFFRYISGDPRTVTSSSLVGTFSQPLLRGAGFKIAMESLTQAERDLLYALREFTRYRKVFSVEIASAYYRVLQNRDAVRNSWRGFQNFKANVEQERAFADEGLRPQAALDQIKQAALQTESRWINAVRSYRDSLDQFKIQLGLSIDSQVILDDRELDKLKIMHPTLTAEEAAQVALEARLDLYNQRDQAEDATRRIEIAKNGLKTQLDLVTGVDVPREQGNGLRGPDFDRYAWSAGVNLDLPFDRKAERNAYRAALIANERAQRQLTLAIDEIKQAINDDWRTLDQANRNFEISELGVQLAERRVEEQELRAELGRGTARDLVDAQNDLINSKNERTTALVGHTIARLNFWRDMGILMIKDDGKWEELSDAETK